jgi:hypothetical protein
MVVFTWEVWQQLRAILEHVKDKYGGREVQGWGRVRVEDDVPVCYEIAIPKQEVSHASVDTSPDDLILWQSSRFNLRPKMGKEEIAAVDEEMKQWRLWWHSHGSMTASFSSTDVETLKDLAEATGDYFLGTVINEGMDANAYLAVSRPFLHYVGLGAASYYLPDMEGLAKEVEGMLEGKLDVKAYSYTPTTHRVPNKGVIGGVVPADASEACWMCFGPAMKRGESILCAECEKEETFCDCANNDDLDDLMWAGSLSEVGEETT